MYVCTEWLYWYCKNSYYVYAVVCKYTCNAFLCISIVRRMPTAKLSLFSLLCIMCLYYYTAMVVRSIMVQTTNGVSSYDQSCTQICGSCLSKTCTLFERILVASPME